VLVVWIPIADSRPLVPVVQKVEVAAVYAVVEVEEEVQDEGETQSADGAGIRSGRSRKGNFEVFNGY
jgi:hypothetical protein